MALTTATVLAGITAATRLVGGMQQQAEGKRQAANAEASAILQGKEQARVSAKEAGIEKREAESHRRKQKVAYLKSGVSLEGSPFLMMEQTRLQGQRNVNEVLSAGGAAVASTKVQGANQAAAYKASGRSAFLKGIGGAAQAAGTLFN